MQNRGITPLHRITFWLHRITFWLASVLNTKRHCHVHFLKLLFDLSKRYNLVSYYPRFFILSIGFLQRRCRRALLLWVSLTIELPCVHCFVFATTAVVLPRVASISAPPRVLHRCRFAVVWSGAAIVPAILTFVAVAAAPTVIALGAAKLFIF
ncbi:uncharacterized protein LOC111241204 [Vigna radiata var. radiata]|uniref:Uncharacterized protein LOC111241204 n=1 Tax=Vigna radiata var. radiata TaxID=3916 RepID=A0A3Q0EUI8_VIGRR|nr:uncharacterized protein LOC111241204 [Vigna radiata var. radiata]